jgi:hypothetical protein
MTGRDLLDNPRDYARKKTTADLPIDVPKPTCAAGERPTALNWAPDGGVYSWRCQACGQGFQWVPWEGRSAKGPETNWTCVDEVELPNKLEIVGNHIGVALARGEMQAWIAVSILIVVALCRAWQMRDKSIVQSLGILALVGAGTYFIAKSIRTQFFYVDDPLVLSIGVVLALSAYLVARGWLNRK